MTHPQPSAEGALGRPPPADIDASDCGGSMDGRACLFYLAVHVIDAAAQSAPTHARVRITPAYARWALEMRCPAEEHLEPIAYEDDRPAWLAYTTGDSQQEDEPYLGQVGPSYVHIDREGLRWCTVLCAHQARIGTEPVCFEELAELVVRSAARQRPSSGPVRIVDCIPSELLRTFTRGTTARTRLPVPLRKAHCIRSARADAGLSREVKP